MKETLEQLTDVPGVLGYFVLNRHGEVLMSDLPASISYGGLRKAGAMVFTSFKSLAAAKRPVEILEWEFQQYRFFAKMFEGGLICILGTLDTALAELYDTVEKIKHTLEKKNTLAQIFTDTSPEEHIKAPVLRKDFFKLMEKKMVKILGSKAKKMIPDILAELNIVPTSTTQAEAIKLINRICEEIGDREVAAKFSGTMYQYFIDHFG